MEKVKVQINDGSLKEYPKLAICELKAVQVNILNWATEKGIFEHATPQTQMQKLCEEVHELDAEISKLPYAYKKNVQLEFGDVLVVLTILAKQLDTDFETCLGMAYDKIKTRTGTMQNGTFVKD